MTQFTVAGIFAASAGIPANTLSGTITMTNSTITAMDLVVPQFTAHFTQIYFNMFNNGSWLLSGQTPGSCECTGGSEDYLTFNFTSGSTLAGFTQAKITNGVVVHNIYFPDGHSSTTYYGLALSGTICPEAGCAPWPVTPVGVPGGVAGSGLLGLALILTIIFFRRHLRSPDRPADGAAPSIAPHFEWGGA